MKSEERVIGGEWIPARERVDFVGILRIRGAGNDETAHVDICGDAHLRRICHCIERALLLVVEGLDRAQGVEGGERGRVRCDRTCCVNGDPLCGEIRLAQRIRDARAGEELKQQYWVLRRCRIELSERGK